MSKATATTGDFKYARTIVNEWDESRADNIISRQTHPAPKKTSPRATMDREFKRSFKQANRGNYSPSVGKTRFLVSVWISEDMTWLDDVHFRYIEDAEVHAARWGRLYGYTVTQITKVEI